MEPIARLPGTKDHPVTIRVNPGGHYVTSKNNEMITTVLGSCIAACIRDPVAGVGGMNHFMLPASATGAWGDADASMRFGNFAMERLINDILCCGGQRHNLEVKVFGGGSIMAGGAAIGFRNADFVETYLREEGLRIASSHLRGPHARRINFYPLTGRVRLLELPQDEIIVMVDEKNYEGALKTQPTCGPMELF
jgi:chemotaxis protein CheD